MLTAGFIGASLLLLMPSPAGAPARLKDPKWTLVWQDKFDRKGLPDPAKWDYEVGKVRNHELQYYTKDRLENARIERRHLIIEGRKESFEGSDYTAASLITLNRFTFKYGRVEVVAKLPKARGTWPAIWLLGADVGQVGWPKCGEIDIMEHVLVTPNKIYGTVHQADFSGQHISKGGTTELPDYGENFHLYALDWSHDEIDFYVDKNKYFVFKREEGKPWAYDREMYLLINLAIGGEWGMQSGLDASAFPQKYEIKSVKIFQAPGMIHHVFPAQP